MSSSQSPTSTHWPRRAAHQRRQRLLLSNEAVNSAGDTHDQAACLPVLLSCLPALMHRSRPSFASGEAPTRHAHDTLLSCLSGPHLPDASARFAPCSASVIRDACRLASALRHAHPLFRTMPRRARAQWCAKCAQRGPWSEGRPARQEPLEPGECIVPPGPRSANVVCECRRLCKSINVGMALNADLRAREHSLMSLMALREVALPNR